MDEGELRAARTECAALPTYLGYLGGGGNFKSRIKKGTGKGGEWLVNGL